MQVRKQQNNIFKVLKESAGKNMPQKKKWNADAAQTSMQVLGEGRYQVVTYSPCSPEE